MDEFQLLNELLRPTGPPSPDIIAAARDRLTHGPSRPRPRLVLTGAGRGRTPALVLAAAATATAAALAAVTLTAGHPQVPSAGLGVFRLPAGAAGTGTGGPGRGILLAAAQAVSQGGQEASGRYWESPAVAGNFIRVGHRDDHYLILETTTNDQYMATRPFAWSPQVVQQLSVRLASPADRAAWRRAGSPATWHVYQQYGLAIPGGGPAVESMFPVTAGRDRLPFVIGAVSTSKPFGVGNASLSARQLLALPADPARLRQLLQPGDLGEWPGGVNSYLFQTVPAVLDLPVTSAVRSALYRMLAELPGVRSAGQVQDVAGHVGMAVTLTGRYACGYYSNPRLGHTVTKRIIFNTPQGEHVLVKRVLVKRSMFCTIQQRLVINPVSGLPMAQELRYVRRPAGQTWSAPGGLFSYEIFGTPHWTNALPRTNPHGR